MSTLTADSRRRRFIYTFNVADIHTPPAVIPAGHVQVAARSLVQPGEGVFQVATTALTGR